MYLTGSTVRPLCETSKCTWGPVERPLEPIRAMVCPFLTFSPTWTRFCILPSGAYARVSATAWLSAAALESDRNQPIELAADSVDIDEGKGVSIYRGDVDLRQGSIRLRADVVTVHQDKRRPSRIVARGEASARARPNDRRSSTIRA